MVVVVNEPYAETEPMLGRGSSDDLANNLRRYSYAEEAYKGITSSMKADPLQIKSPKTALELLWTGARLQNMPLVKQCIENLDQQLDRNNVLMIYSNISKCKMPNYEVSNDFEPSAPPIVESDKQRNTNWVLELTDCLRYNCLLEIDKHADYFLRQKELMDLVYTDLLDIVKRDTLQVSDEAIVYGAVYRWAVVECQRRTMSPHDLNIKAVLRDLAFAPRLAFMPRSKIMAKTIDGCKGPKRIKIFSEDDWAEIDAYFNQLKFTKTPEQKLGHNWTKPRIIGNLQPKLLSLRSCSPSLPSANAANFNTQTDCQTKTKCEQCLINFLTCWTAIFD